MCVCVGINLAVVKTDPLANRDTYQVHGVSMTGLIMVQLLIELYPHIN